ncbi:unnamed protein product [Prorocentrum cordatum]|uniref:Uncharacterized protein n=1 Tax=Prorocentrum cordatum TaxID=2364126 RepID=A0ABN9V6P2_9DINO|nr:unnamed protein product [Polarella glacialis]
MVKHATSLSELEVRRFLEGLASGPSDITNASGKCHVTTTMETLANTEGLLARTKVHVTWCKGSGYVSVRTKAVVEDEAVRMLKSLDMVHKKLMKGEVIPAPDGGETAVATFRNPAWSEYEEFKSPEKAESDDWQMPEGKGRYSHVPDNESYHLGIQTICETVNVELNDHPLFRAKLLRLLVRDFGASEDNLIDTEVPIFPKNEAIDRKVKPER